MLKYHKLTSLVFGLLFLIVLQTFATPQPVFRYLGPAFVVFSIVVTLYNRWYLKTLQKYNKWTLLRPVLLFTSAFGLFLVLPNEFLRGLFLILTVVLIAFFEIILGNSAENLLLNETLIIAFGLFVYFFGAYHYAPNYQPFYLAGIFASCFLLVRSFYEHVPQSNRVKALGAVTIGLFSSEIFWVSNFTHFHFSFLALASFNIFYFCLILNYYHLYHILNFKKIQFHLLLMVTATALVILTTPWRLV